MAAAAASRGEIVDRIVASIGTQVVTLSDVQQADRLERFFNRQPLEKPNAARIRSLASRLIDQLLLRQEMEASRFPVAAPGQVDERLAELQKEYGGEAQFRAALGEYGLDEAALRRYLETRLNILRFIDLRFRPMVAVEEPDIENYYRATLLPRLRQAGSQETPPLDQVHDRIEAVLTQERVNQVYAQWLEDLRSQAGIQYR